MRYVVEGEWTGYTSGQRKIVHREVITKKRAERLKRLHAVDYTDGTSLLVFVREAKPREQVQEIHGYTSLLRKAEEHGGNRMSVRDLP